MSIFENLAHLFFNIAASSIYARFDIILSLKMTTNELLYHLGKEVEASCTRNVLGQVIDGILNLQRVLASTDWINARLPASGLLLFFDGRNFPFSHSAVFYIIEKNSRVIDFKLCAGM